MSRRAGGIGWLLAAAGAVVVGGVVFGEAQAMNSYGETTQPGRNFTWDELTRSGTALKLHILNAPNAAQRANLRTLVTRVLQPIRDARGQPVHIDSAFRSAALNRAIGGSDTSQHMSGEAADIKVDGMTSSELAAFIVRLGIPFDQLIAYPPELGGHVHVSYDVDGANRLQTLWSPAKKVYEPRVFA